MTTLTARTHDQWNNSADAYDRHTRTFDTHRRIADQLALLAPRNTSAVLDFGCGPGNSTRLLRRTFPHAHITGLDASPAMIRLARHHTSDPTISYHCGNPAAGDPLTGLTRGRYDLVAAANSLFHVDDKAALLDGLTPLLTPDATIVFSLYDTVFTPNDPIRWPLREQHDDTLMTLLIDELRARGHAVTRRQEDREILTEASLRHLFAAAGFSVHCGAVLRLHRTAQERLSFFSIPATAAEVFPDIPASDVRDAAANLIPTTTGLPPQERCVYAFVATRSPK
jgi:trans-aconitate methyltransferase